MSVGSFYYLNGNYVYGIADHANGMKSSVPWATAGIATDAMSLMQLLGTSGASAMGATEFAAAAATPIINAGLITLTVASNTLGFGRPEDGERFGNGSSTFDDTKAVLRESIPPEDWQGDARDAYHDRNAEQQVRANDMAEHDAKVEEILLREAGQVENTREFVSKRQTVLAANIPAALLARAIPGAGPAISTAIEIAAVLATVPFALDRVEDMVHHAGDNAKDIAEIAARYESVAAGTQRPGGGFGSA